ncbi:MAG: hypothetical protein IKS99_05705 [Firmicutes bacterium]|nr:hypothetical protein [Bacillota bacterium]
MKRILCLMLIVAMAFTMAACGKDKPIDEGVLIPTPTQTMDAFLQALKARDLDMLKDYYEGDVGDLSLLEEIDEPALSGMVDSMMEKILDFDYTLDNEVIDGNEATVDVYFKTYDFADIMEKLIAAILQDAMVLSISGLDQDELEAEINEIMASKFEELMKTAEKDQTVKVTMPLVMKSNKWLVKDINKLDDFTNALFGGLTKYAEGLDLFD